jgi:hypothetical protein
MGKSDTVYKKIPGDIRGRSLCINMGKAFVQIVAVKKTMSIYIYLI